MRVPYTWLSQWVRVPWEARELGSRLTLAGFELEVLERAAPPFSGVIVAEILDAAPHPQAQKLNICTVATGTGEPLRIVCGARNARAGLKTALAQVGAELPGGIRIKAAKLRGVESFGMLTSSKELGLSESSDGILELPADAPIGATLREYLALDDWILELSVTPNRGDAMSIIGIAREVAALSGGKLTGPALKPVAASLTDTIPVHLDAPAACPKFAARVIRGLDNRAATPLWMRERLRRCGLRTISPVVDVTNYVLLELGQPMHAYDLAKLGDEVHVRNGRGGETVTLLDGRTVSVDEDVLVIADREAPVALAGIMGGERTAVGEATTDVLLEVAYFAPEAIAGRARRFGLHTDASQRFERGVDPAQQERALERATALILEVAGGRVGPAIVTAASEHLPNRLPVILRRARLDRLLGVSLAPEQVTATLTALGMRVTETAEGWQVTPPSHRFDVGIEPDLVEETARIVGFGVIPERAGQVPLRFPQLPEAIPAERSVLEALAARGYQEAITFAFVDSTLQARLFPERVALPLSNPIARELDVMRVSLWPGLLRTALENQRRQQDRVRLMEHGTRFLATAGATLEIDTLAALAAGGRLAEQWGLAPAARGPVDFFDVKADLEALLAATGAAGEFSFEAASLSCLHPGKTARILRQGSAVGWLGELHPTLVRDLGWTEPPILLEIDWQALKVAQPGFAEVSRFPGVRRDLALVVDEEVSLSALRERVTLVASSLLRSLRVFDVYRGPGVEKGRKSVALGLIFQDISRTLTDEDADRAVASVVSDLRTSVNAKIRE